MKILKPNKAVHRIIGRWRVLFNVCPRCNEDAPAVDDCFVCKQVHIKTQLTAVRSGGTDYGRLIWGYSSHFVRWKRRVKQFDLPCQECGGSGGEVEPVLDYGEGPWIVCGWCEGTGGLDPWRRGLWLRIGGTHG